MFKWEKLQLSQLGENLCHRIDLFISNNSVLATNAPFKQLQKDIFRFIWQGKNSRVKYKVLQDAKQQGVLALPDMKLYFATYYLVWMKMGTAEK